MVWTVCSSTTDNLSRRGSTSPNLAIAPAIAGSGASCLHVSCKNPATKKLIKTTGMYDSSRSAVLLEGEESSTFSVEQGVAQGCSLSPILFTVFISDLLNEID